MPIWSKLAVTFRGPLLDCARHWHPPNMLLNFFDALSFHKQNALIWGVGIDQSFVVESAAFPNICAHASFGPPGAPLRILTNIGGDCAAQSHNHSTALCWLPSGMGDAVQVAASADQSAATAFEEDFM